VLADRQLAPALEQIHQRPDHPWTVAELASQVGMSRTAFAMRFTRVAGIPPLTYLRRWRALKATDLLGRGDVTLAEVAAHVGYDSEAAFAKAFKRELGVAPGAYRQHWRSRAFRR
jgi:AraC-like DNA-binding protein